MMIDHYMVDFINDAGNVAFANDTPIDDLTAAKSLASKTSKQVDTGAYVVAFTENSGGKTYTAVGHISFFDGKQSETDGVVI
jgi:hypothetical protein